jgi:uncharacterized protein (TIGR02996 family)
MTDDSTFLRALLTSPNDNDLRLIYADWLEERGDPRAPFLRLEVALHETKSSARPPELCERLNQARRHLMDHRHNHDNHSRGGPLLGTLPYASPEQARGELERVDRRSDVFELGAILCEVLTGQPPFTGTPEEVKTQAQAGHLGPVQQRLESCGADADLVALARSCLAARPEDRLADAGEVAALVSSCRAAAEQRFWEAAASRIRADAIADELRKRRRVQHALAVAVGLLAVACIALALR